MASFIPSPSPAIAQTPLSLELRKSTQLPIQISNIIESYLTSTPQKLVSSYWNVTDNKASLALSRLIELLLPDLPAVPSLDQIVVATQKAWLQKARWDITADPLFIKERRSQIQPLLTELGLTSSFLSQGHYDTALLLAGRANIFIARTHALCQAIKERRISLSQVDILVGTQPLHELEIGILRNCCLHISDVKTEREMVIAVAEQMLRPLGIRYNIIATDLPGNRKPNTEQTVNTWLEARDRSGMKALIVSDPQFAVHQYLQCMDSLFKKEITDVHFDLLACQLDSSEFIQLAISEEETQGSPILLHLDTIARTLYTLKSQIDRGRYR